VYPSKQLLHEFGLLDEHVAQGATQLGKQPIEGFT
jgi:hypothetical protein